MTLFHGTKKQNVQAILKQGLQPLPVREWRKSWWYKELRIGPSVFLSNEPKAGIGSSPVEFASFGEGDGYLIVVDIPKADLEKRLRGIWTTHDLDVYWEGLWKQIRAWAIEFTRAGHGFSTENQRPFLEWIFSQHPWTVGQLCIRDGWVSLNRHWLFSRKRTSPCSDCQLLVKDIPPSFIVGALKVYSGRSGKILPQFDPKRQSKRKHKEKTFRSLVWHHVRRMMQ